LRGYSIKILICRDNTEQYVKVQR